MPNSLQWHIIGANVPHILIRRY